MGSSDSDIEKIGAALTSGRLSINRLDDGSGVVLDVEREQLVSMNRTGLMIIQAIADGARGEAAIAAWLSQQFSIDLSRARHDLTAFTQRLATAL